MNSAVVHHERAISPAELQQKLAAGEKPELLDVRTAPEFARAHIPAARHAPLDTLDVDAILRHRRDFEAPIYIVCETGGRARRAIAKFKDAGCDKCVLIEGGMQAWLQCGLDVERTATSVLPLMQQVQVAVGGASLLGAVLALAVDPWFALIPLVTGTGLLIAGLTGFCGLALVLARMPWNQQKKPMTPRCCETNE